MGAGRLLAIAAMFLLAACQPMKPSAWPPETTAGLYRTGYAALQTNPYDNEARTALEMLETVLSIAVEQEKCASEWSLACALRPADTDLRLAEIAIAYSAAALVQDRHNSFRVKDIIDKAANRLWKGRMPGYRGACLKMDDPDHGTIAAKLCLLGSITQDKGRRADLLQIANLDLALPHLAPGIASEYDTIDKTFRDISRNNNGKSAHIPITNVFDTVAIEIKNASYLFDDKSICLNDEGYAFMFRENIDIVDLIKRKYDDIKITDLAIDLDHFDEDAQISKSNDPIDFYSITCSPIQKLHLRSKRHKEILRIDALRKLRDDINNSQAEQVRTSARMVEVYTPNAEDLEFLKAATKHLSENGAEFIDQAMIHSIGTLEKKCDDIFHPPQKNADTKHLTTCWQDYIKSAIWYQTLKVHLHRLLKRPTSGDLAYLTDRFRERLRNKERDLITANTSLQQEEERRRRSGANKSPPPPVTEGGCPTSMEGKDRERWIDCHLGDLPHHRAFEHNAGVIRDQQNWRDPPALWRDTTAIIVTVPKYATGSVNAASPINIAGAKHLAQALKPFAANIKRYRLIPDSRPTESIVDDPTRPAGKDEFTDVTYESLLKALKEINSRQLLLAWMGHGERGKLFLPDCALPEDCTAGHPLADNDVINFDALHKIVTTSRVLRALLLIDACHSGSAAAADIKEKSPMMIAGITAEADATRLVYTGDSLLEHVAQFLDRLAREGVSADHLELYDDLSETHRSVVRRHQGKALPPASDDRLLQGAAPGLYTLHVDDANQFASQRFIFPHLRSPGK